MTIKLLIVEDHLIVRELLKPHLEAQADMSVIGEAGNGLTAVQIAQELQPDVVVMDIRLPGLDGREATRQITRACPKTRVVILTMLETKQDWVLARQAGALGYVVKGDPPVDLLTAIRDVQRGQPFCSRSLANNLAEEVLMLEGQNASDGLTPRQQEVLRLIAEGLTAKEVAHKLAIAESTVKNHLSQIKRKLGYHTKAELIKYAIHKGLVVLPS